MFRFFKIYTLSVLLTERKEEVEGGHILRCSLRTGPSVHEFCVLLESSLKPRLKPCTKRLLASSLENIACHFVLKSEYYVKTTGLPCSSKQKLLTTVY